jgi:hypothetical protein
VRWRKRTGLWERAWFHLTHQTVWLSSYTVLRRRLRLSAARATCTASASSAAASPRRSRRARARAGERPRGARAPSSARGAAGPRRTSPSACLLTPGSVTALLDRLERAAGCAAPASGEPPLAARRLGPAGAGGGGRRGRSATTRPRSERAAAAADARPSAPRRPLPSRRSAAAAADRTARHARRVVPSLTLEARRSERREPRRRGRAGVNRFALPRASLRNDGGRGDEPGAQEAHRLGRESGRAGGSRAGVRLATIVRRAPSTSAARMRPPTTHGPDAVLPLRARPVERCAPAAAEVAEGSGNA